jgi:hypothetical protein
LTSPQVQQLIGQPWDVCPDAGRGRSRALGFPDRVLLVLTYRTNLTRQQLEALFGISDSAVHRVIDRLAPHLAALLGPPPTHRREPRIADGTPIPVHDKNRTTTSNNYRRSVNTQIVCRAKDRRIVAVSEGRPENRNDTVVVKETPGKTPPEHRRLTGDGGHRGNPHTRSPRRGPDGRIIRDRNHRRFRKRRARAEPTTARLKDHQTLRPCRRHGTAVNDAIADVAALHNLKLETA